MIIPPFCNVTRLALAMSALPILACAAPGVVVSETGPVVSIENTHVRVSVDGLGGLVDFVDLATGEATIRDAELLVDEAGFVPGGTEVTWRAEAADGPLGPGRVLTVSWTAAGQPGVILQVALAEDHPAVAMRAGLSNTTAEARRVRTIAPLARATAFPGVEMAGNLVVLDGRGGARHTAVVRGEYVDTLNNALLSVETANGRRSIVLGGLTYADFEKGVEVGRPVPRRDALGAWHGEAPLAYLDLGSDTESGTGAGLRARLAAGEPFDFNAEAAREFVTIAFDPAEIVVEADGLEPGKHYQVGVTWFDLRDDRTQSIHVDAGPGTEETVVVHERLVPGIRSNRLPEEIRLPVDPAWHPDGRLRVKIRRETGPNAIASEFWVRETSAPAERLIHGLARHAAIERGPVPLRLAAHDPVGRLVEPGELYLPGDWFYVDVVTACPFEGLERYGRAVRQAQGVALNAYVFPTVCLWYAMHPRFGGGPAYNDSPGAVAEMQRIAESGFLRYARAAVRLVPDNYGENNQQGWWSDERWRMYGSGVYPGNVVVEGGHLKEPYETTAKWAGAVRELGGEPLMYVQTGYRSEDFCQQHPGWMIGNDPANTYDYTDPGFRDHLRGVYANLRGGGIAGMMFDFPATGWIPGGGFEDHRTTTAAAYRLIYAAARQGLGAGAYLHERDLARGSDITTGLVDSERVWGDTDVLVPEMVARCGLRWYKNRTVIAYDMDSKSLRRAATAGTDAKQALVTMCYVTSGRFLLADSFGKLAPDEIHTLSRVYPYHETPRSARPVDAFLHEFPRVYQYPVTADWHQVTLYNSGSDALAVRVPMAGDPVDGALALDPSATYHVYDFWNDTYVGTVEGAGELAAELRPHEARMLSVRRQLDRPQVLSTDRHIMQGYLELEDVAWDPAAGTMAGTLAAIAGEPTTIAIATNGRTPSGRVACAQDAALSTREGQDGVVYLTITSGATDPVRWSLGFE